MVFSHFDQTKINFSEQLHHFSGLSALALKKNYLFIFFVKYYLKKKKTKNKTHTSRGKWILTRKYIRTPLKSLIKKRKAVKLSN